MKRLVSPKGLKGWQKFGLFLLLLLAAAAIWQGCSDDPVTPRKSVVGVWELTTLKIDGEETDYLFDVVMVFDAEGTGYMHLYSGEDLINADEFESWEVEGDSIFVTVEGETEGAWYSCTSDRLTIREYDESEDETLEWIYARVEDL